ncbi:MAG: transposase, partial [Pseudanabaena sp. M046S1SP1A06QC]|nr:transposase [Pseudanabaena sp. M046S1SP1A06QC]
MSIPSELRPEGQTNSRNGYSQKKLQGNFGVAEIAVLRVCADLKAIYAAATASEAEFNLELFAEKWDKQYPSISKSWRNHWAHIIPFFAFPSEIRRAIYITNAIESMNSSLRKVIKSQQIFPSDEAAFKLVYLAMRNISKKWTMPIRDWKHALD